MPAWNASWADVSECAPASLVTRALWACTLCTRACARECFSAAKTEVVARKVPAMAQQITTFAFIPFPVRGFDVVWGAECRAIFAISWSNVGDFAARQRIRIGNRSKFPA